MLFRTVAIVLRGAGPPSRLRDQPASTQESTAKIWVGRYQEIEEYLRTAECVSLQGSDPRKAMRCTLRPGGPVARLAWRSLPRGLPRILGELQDRDRRVRARQAPEDGHGAADRGAAARRPSRVLPNCGWRTSLV